MKPSPLRRLAVVFCVLAAVGVTPTPATATPIRNATPWSVLLCRFSDRPATPQTTEFFANFLTDAGRGTGGVADYLADQSGGRISLAGSAVLGWYTMTWSRAQFDGIDRSVRIQRCVDTAAAAGYTVPSGHRVAVILNDAVDAGSAGGRVLLDPNTWNTRFAAHEMLHGYGLDHSWSDDTTYRNVSWAQPGEYDDMWDEMSAQHTYSVDTRYGAGAVGLNAYHLDELGWLPRNRVLTVGADGVGTRTVTMAPLEARGEAGLLLARIPFDANDTSRYYTVEYRRKTGWSAGIPGDTVLLHEIRNGTPYLLRTGPGGGPRQSLDANGVRVTVQGATVTITTAVVNRPVYGPNTCVNGYVWRDADQTDYVCVTPETRAEAAADNAAAPSRWVAGAYGPHTCVNGYVWREAFIGDDVCVVPDRRSRAAADNAAGPGRVLRPAG
ncbi:hypothetical protein Q0Z83_012340 [Actinoplanes sichuanensis]|uniref:Uncharacterized protein n=1 Tax=Actinoplanes sichuanensis TaxID=512349 RepID=A0ABW4A4Y4_9ACTN|nr:hypothetical protein [Actinoplanes sichuanensis]BEL03043.1 hypothetical protein Q0Z83_012340 [Actinoplanes sichuanensis]